VSGARSELGPQTDKPTGAYGALEPAAEDAGFDVVTAFNDLWFQPRGATHRAAISATNRWPRWTAR
jgi:hypothetical protein